MLFFGKNLRGQALNAAQHVIFFIVAFFVGKAAGVVFQDLGARVAQGVHRVAHAVNQAAAVTGFLADDLAQHLAHFAVILRVLHIGQDVIQLVHNFQVGTAVLGAFQGTDGRRDGCVCIGAGGGQHTGGKGGAVAAAVVCVNQQAQIQQACFLVGELLVCTVGAQNVLRSALPGDGVMEVHAFVVIHTALELVGVHHHGGQLGNQVDALGQDVGQAQIIGVLVIAVHRKHAARHLIHNVGGGRVHDHVVRKALGQFAVLINQLAEPGILFLGGQCAKQQQPHHFLKHEAVVLVGFGGQSVNINAAVNQAARNGADGAFGQLFVTNNAGNIGNARQNTGAVRVAQTALNAKAVRNVGVKMLVVRNILIAQKFNIFRVKRRNIRVIHQMRPPYFPAKAPLGAFACTLLPARAKNGHSARSAPCPPPCGPKTLQSAEQLQFYSI